MMTDPMTPLGLSVWQLTAARPMAEAGGRLFVDVTRALASPVTRAGLLEVMGKGDPLIGNALQAIVDRGDFIRSVHVEDAGATPPSVPPMPSTPIETDPAIVTGLIARTEASVAALRHDIGDLSGTALLDFILEDVAELRRLLFDPLGRQVFMSAMDAASWLNDRLLAWLGEKNVADTLTLSVPNNVTSAMGLALLDVADAIRPHPGVVAFLRQVDDDGFLDELPALDGGRDARDAILGWLDRYGMRGVGEIDITRPRWSERPATLLPLILGHVDGFGAARRRAGSSRDGGRPRRRNGTSWHACGRCRPGTRRPTRRSG